MKKEQILGLIRHSLTFIGGILIMKGVIDETSFTEISGALISIIGGVWSIIDKK
jgi:hypothetical protein